MVCDGCDGILSAAIASKDAATTSSYQSGDWVGTGNARYIFIASPCVRFNNRLFSTLFNLYKTPTMKSFGYHSDFNFVRMFGGHLNKLTATLITVGFPLLFLLIWSGGALFSKLGLQYANTWSFLFLRAALALVLLLILFGRKVKHNNNDLKTHAIEKSELYRIVISGLLLQVFYLIFYFSAIKTQLSLGIIILILGIQPIMTKLMVSDALNKVDIILLVMCFTGLGIATLGYHNIEKINLIGIVLAIFALLSITFGTVIQAKITTEPVLTLLIQTITAFVVFAILTAVNGFVFSFNVYSLAALIWMGAIVFVGAFLLLTIMLRFRSAEKVSTLFFLLPLITMILESMFFHTKLNGFTIAGDILVCVSLFLYQFKPFSPKK